MDNLRQSTGLDLYRSTGRDSLPWAGPAGVAIVQTFASGPLTSRFADP